MTEKDLKEIKENMLKNIEPYKELLGDRKVEDLTLKDFDFQGWLIPHITLRKALMNLGFNVNKKGDKFYINNDSEILDAYPLILKDDGMAYGALNGKLTDCYKSNNKDGELEINLWF